MMLKPTKRLGGVEPTNLQKMSNFPAVLYKIDRKVQKLAFKFVGLILLSDCKWQLDAPEENVAVRPWWLHMGKNQIIIIFHEAKPVNSHLAAGN